MSATPQQQFDAIKAAIDTALQAAPGTAPADRKAYDFDNVPTTRPSAYVALDLSRRYIEGFRKGGPHPSRGGRLVTRYVAKHIDDVRELQRRVWLAIEDKALTTTDGSLVGPFRFETPISIDTDDGWASGADSWTFTNAR